MPNRSKPRRQPGFVAMVGGIPVGIALSPRAAAIAAHTAMSAVYALDPPMCKGKPVLHPVTVTVEIREVSPRLFEECPFTADDFLENARDAWQAVACGQALAPETVH